VSPGYLSLQAFDPSAFDLRCEWGPHGLAQLAPISDVIVIVDVCSFSTSVEIATRRGAVVFPYHWRGDSAAEFAARVGAELASAHPGVSKYSLSPRSLLDIPPGTRLVLPSPNGSTLSLSTGATPTLAGCLRNGRAVARAAQALGERIAVIPAGEQWSDSSLRPALEDWLGAGAILRHLAGRASPEARAAIAAFEEALPDLANRLQACASGQELLERGREHDLGLAAELDVSECAPILRNGAYINHWVAGKM
jgi:2-phosphosulfolactate phosphatase